MRIALAYITVSQGVATADFAARFVATYHEFPAGEPHELFVVCNGGPLALETGLLFASAPCRFFPRENSPGWDLDGFRAAARGPCADFDMLLCLGESVYFHRAGWLTRLAEAWGKYGPGMYGPFASHCVRAHLNTNAFAVAPKWLTEYPFTADNRAERYGFEHGERAFWRWLNARRLPTMLVTWDGEWNPGQWRYPANILTRGNQSNCLMFCNHTERFTMAPLPVKMSMAAASDRPFR